MKPINISAHEKVMNDFLIGKMAQAMKELENILKDDKQRGTSWSAIPPKSNNRYIKVATLKRVLRLKLGHHVMLKSEIKHDCEHRVVIQATLSHRHLGFLSSGLAERWKNPKSSNIQSARAVECCQTAAWGRCIKSLLAFGNDISTADEIDKTISDINEEIDKEIK